ncbi:MAG: DUF1684 domain-containing protein [Ignavibacteria bacterium]|nr:DUF1684 domain-containing protein [Ignavibacteria bacterium]
MLKGTPFKSIAFHISFSSFLVPALILAVAASCSGDRPAGAKVFSATRILEQRKMKDDAFSDAKRSPLSSVEIARFHGLHYYEPNADYAVRAVLKRSEELDTLTMQTTTSELRQVVRIGVFEFLLGGKRHRLTAFAYIEARNNYELFVPFKDATNGIDTYEVGRYMNIEPLEDDSAYLIDFNEAYNPFCAYNEVYSCPLIPVENVLSTAIAAGEKKWK